jgi:histidinol phosphatase-like enzyme (inositol monophosphatase family)
MIALIRAERPDDAIEGEETGRHSGRSSFTWYLDPIDGTRAYVAGLTSWTTLIGLVEDNRPVLGIIDQPFLDELYIGAGGRAWIEHKGSTTALRARSCTQVTSAVLSTTDPFLFTANEQAAFAALRETAPITRYGLDAYAYARLAAGGIDLVAESGLKAHDVAALIPVIEGAGGVTADWHGAPAGLGGRLLAAATPELLEEAVARLAAHTL